MRTPRVGSYPTGQDIVGAQLGHIQKTLDDLDLADKRSTGSNVTIPEIDLSFAPIFTPDVEKNGVQVTLAFLIPVNTDRLRVQFIYTADRGTATNFKRKRKHTVIQDIDEVEAQAGRIERTLKPILPYATQIDIFRLVAFAGVDEGDEGARNPEDDPLFTDPPLLQFTTPIPFDVPSSPALSLIRENALDPTTKEYDAYVILRQHAPLTLAGGAQTYRQAANTHAKSALTRTSTNQRKHEHRRLTEAELDQVDAASTPANRGFVDLTIDGLAPGALYTWDKNHIWANAEHKESVGAPVSFNAAGFTLDPAGLTGSLSFTINTAEPYSPKFAGLDLNLTQPALIVALKHMKVRRKILGALDSTYRTVLSKKSLRDDEWHTAGAKVITLMESLHTKPSRSYTLQGILTCIGGLTITFTQNYTTGSDQEVPADTGSPGPAGLNKPILKFLRGLFAKMSMSGITNVQQLQTVELNINDGTNSLNIDDPTSDVPVPGTTTFYQLAKGPKVHLDFSKKRLKKIFSAAAQLKARFILTTLGFAGTQSQDSDALPLSDAVDVGPVGNNGNILWNGHFTQLEGAGTLGNWQAYKTTTGTFDILDTGSGKLRYQDAEHRCKWQVNPVSDSDSNKRWLVQHIGDIIRGDSYALTFRVLADGNRTVDFDVFLATIVGTTVTIENYDSGGVNRGVINLTATLVANVYKDVELTFRFATDADVGGNTFFVVRLNSRVDQSEGDPFVFADEFMMVPGLTPVPFAARVLREYNTVPSGPVASTSAYATGEEFDVDATAVGGGIYEQVDGAPDPGTGRIYDF